MKKKNTLVDRAEAGRTKRSGKAGADKIILNFISEGEWLWCHL